MMNVEISDTDLAYIAGYVDGEGCISASGNVTIRIEITNTYLSTIEWIQSLFGGKMYIEEHNNDNHRTRYRLFLYSNEANLMLNMIYPFLKEKSEQAELAMTLHYLPKGSGRNDKPNAEILELRKEIITKLKELKKGS